MNFRKELNTFRDSQLDRLNGLYGDSIYSDGGIKKSDLAIGEVYLFLTGSFK